MSKNVVGVVTTAFCESAVNGEKYTRLLFNRLDVTPVDQPSASKQ